MNYWLNSFYYPSETQQGIKQASIQNTSETLWIAEINGVTQADITADPDTNSYQCYPSQFGAYQNRTNPNYGVDTLPEPRGRLTKRHFDGLNVLWADGHAKWMRRSILETDIGYEGGSKYWWGR